MQHSKPKHQNQNSDTRQDQNIKRGFEMFTKVMATLGENDDRKFRQTDDLAQALKQHDRNLGQRRDRFGDYEPIRQPQCHYCRKPGHFEKQCLQKMRDRQQLMEHGSSYPTGNGGQGRTGNQYGFGSQRGGSFQNVSGQSRNQNFSDRRGYSNQYHGGNQSRNFTPPTYSSQLEYATRVQNQPQLQAEQQASSGNKFRQAGGGNSDLNQQ